MISRMLARAPRSLARLPQRSFASSSIVSKDFVQELYLKELKAYKTPTQSKDAHVGHVKEFHTPSAPKAPTIPSSADLAKELEAYANEVRIHSLFDREGG
ncbi:uncharacterized protein L969DRAFT_92144 [Mixia osmundae IAM 14324]|uniref:Uncharacterized protein n=1 Tax=Mixia osmundae (strain CBS 9802 / IAM 14324 / JCM 22182 / KY 12970) TaxID=764103 RepID=G7DT71_MIXOS|nr:uncharacterized protein L969DRAFT_92144 [Mixia osmundae IAM 14324]KEI42716.1 hypothetical protein L969DRAFT_92144 [Mixia osmundae IAM 14324]GAA93950.1 hypothetical protein E5Q_00596 [Mixia osmundae IAM 14324]